MQKQNIILIDIVTIETETLKGTDKTVKTKLQNIKITREK